MVIQGSRGTRGHQERANYLHVALLPMFPSLSLLANIFLQRQQPTFPLHFLHVSPLQPNESMPVWDEEEKGAQEISE